MKPTEAYLLLFSTDSCQGLRLNCSELFPDRAIHMTCGSLVKRASPALP